MTTTAWWHCFSGIAGDMALGSLIDAGADLDEVGAGLDCLPVSGWRLETEKTARGGLSATRAIVHVAPEADLVDRTWATIKGLLEGSAGLPERARRRALQVFARLAEAEGAIHGVSPDNVHFHEVGGLDAIVDVVGTCLALEALDISAVHASSVALGVGTLTSAHGALPNPAPAVVELLRGAPVHGTGHPAELTTPTGAALLVGLDASFAPLPPMTVKATGFGAGSRDRPDVANVLQVVVGDVEVAGRPTWEPGAPARREDLAVLEANVDDVTGEVLAHTVGALMAAGALDAWLVPVVGKKGRPGHIVSALAAPSAAVGLGQVLARETGTLGFRQYPVSRWAFDRQVLEVDVDGQPVRVKVGPHRAKAEHDDCARAASALGLTVSEVALRAEQSARSGARP